MRFAMKKIIFIVLIIFNVMVFFFSAPLAVLSKTPPSPGKQDTVYVLCVPGSNRQDSATPPPGEYLMEVKNIDNNNGPNEAKNPQIRVIVIPQFWNTWWFQSLCLLAAAAVFFGIYQVRVKFIALQREQGEKMNGVFSRYRLSSREQEIALFLLKGETNGTIENKLYISAHTVKNHIYHIYRKLGVKNRVQLTNLCRDIL